jgi:hypothetical protein
MISPDIWIWNDDDEYKPFWPSGLWTTSWGGETSRHTTAHDPSYKLSSGNPLR